MIGRDAREGYFEAAIGDVSVDDFAQRDAEAGFAEEIEIVEDGRVEAASATVPRFGEMQFHAVVAIWESKDVTQFAAPITESLIQRGIVCGGYRREDTTHAAECGWQMRIGVCPREGTPRVAVVVIPIREPALAVGVGVGRATAVDAVEVIIAGLGRGGVDGALSD